MSKKATSTSLEQKISTALADPQVTSTDLMELIEEAELVVTAAENTRERSTLSRRPTS